MMIAGIVLLVLGAAALFLGLRGRRIDDHPICRRCGFDVHGLAPESTTCPECGADLARAWATRRGQRRRRVRLIVTGLLLLGVSAAMLGVLGWAYAKDIDLSRHKPAWLLTLEARWTDGPSARACVSELQRRLKDGKLSQAATRRAIDAGLTVQTDASRTWWMAWSEFIEAAATANAFTDEQWRTLLRQGLQVSIRARPEICEGDALPVEITVSDERAAWVTGLDVRPSVDFIRVGDRVEMKGIEPETPDGYGSVSALPALLPIDLPPGAHEITIGVRMFTRKMPQRWLAAWNVESRHTVRVVPDDATSPRLVYDEALAPRVRAAVETSVGRLDAWGSLKVGVRVHRAPVDLAFDVFVVRDGIERRAGSFTARAEATVTGLSFAAPPVAAVLGPANEWVDVVLRPSPAAARGTVDLLEIWGGEILFENVPVGL